jgi:hypothetical protein
MKNLFGLVGVVIAGCIFAAEPSWADVAKQAATRYGGSGKEWGYYEAPWAFFLATGIGLWFTYNLMMVFRPFAYIAGAISVFMFAHGIAIIGNFYGSNPRGDVSIFTYQNPYFISKYEHDRLWRLAWKFQEDCRGNNGCTTSVWRAFQDCKSFNNCRGVMVEVYNERRRELAENPHAFSSFKPCEDRSINSWAKCW